jgi:hypothetical protein
MLVFIQQIQHIHQIKGNKGWDPNQWLEDQGGEASQSKNKNDKNCEEEEKQG